MSEKVRVVCPHCRKVNKIPKREGYKKANCGHCKNSLLDSRPVEVNKDDFMYFLVNSDIPVVVDFWAPWCGPCKMMAPAYEEAALSIPLQAQFLKVNTDIEGDLGMTYNIRSIPTLIVYKDTREIDRVSGAMSTQGLIGWVKRFT